MQPGRYGKGEHHTSKSHLGFFVLLGVLSVGTVLYLSGQAQAAILETEGKIIAADNTAPQRSARRLQLKQLKKEIQAAIDAESGTNVSVAFHDFVTGKTLLFGSNESFVAASVPKLLTASLWLHEVDQGKRSLDEPVGTSTAREQLRLLIEISDNAAWDLLDEKLGKPALENYAKSIGMQQYNFDENALSSRDVLVLLKKLYTGNLLKEPSQKQLLEWMGNANYTQYIVAALPDSAKSYHKVGFLADRVLDAAVVENKQLSYALVVFTENDGGFDLASAGSLVREITDIVQSRFEK